MGYCMRGRRRTLLRCFVILLVLTVRLGIYLAQGIQGIQGRQGTQGRQGIQGAIGSGSGESLWDVSTDNTTVYLKDPTDNVRLSRIEVKPDGGVITLVDMPIITGSGEQSYSMRLDGAIALKIHGIATGGSVDEYSVVVQANYLSFGDPCTNGSWRLMVNENGDLAFEKRIAGNWVERGKFI